jgi:hypothetical protein
MNLEVVACSRMVSALLILTLGCGAAFAQPVAPSTNKPTYAPLRARVVTNMVVTRSTVQLITGRTFLRGVPPPEKVISMDAACAQLNPAAVTTRHYEVGEEGVLANVFVYVKDAPSNPVQAGLTAVQEQIGCQFQPYILGVQPRQKIVLRNMDSVLGNAHITTKNPGNTGRNLALLGGGTVSFSFDVPELFVQLKTDVHPWMYAYICVVDHPWFAVTDRKGIFVLPSGLPPGKYTLVATHRKAGEQSQQIHVTANGTSPASFTFDVPPR